MSLLYRFDPITDSQSVAALSRSFVVARYRWFGRGDLGVVEVVVDGLGDLRVEGIELIPGGLDVGKLLTPFDVRLVYVGQRVLGSFSELADLLATLADHIHHLQFHG